MTFSLTNVEHNDKLQLAEALKYSSAHVWHFAEIRPGLYALYTHERKIAYITDDWLKLLTAYRGRSKYLPSPRLIPLKKFDIDLSQLDLTI